MIKAIEIENFKSFHQVTKIELNNMTLFAGKNSSGKSTIAQALLLLEQSELSLYPINGNMIPFLKLNSSNVQIGKSSEALYDEEKGWLSITIYFSNRTIIKCVYSNDNRLKEASRKTLKEKNILLLSKCEYISKDFQICASLENNNWKIHAIGALSFFDSTINESIHDYMLEKLKDLKVENRYEIFNSEVEFESVNNLIFSFLAPKSFSINYIDIDKCLRPEYRSFYDPLEFAKYVVQKNYTEDDIVLENTYHYLCFKNIKEISNIEYLPPFRGMPKRVYTDIDGHNPIIDLNEYIDSVIDYDYDFEQKKVRRGTVRNAIDFWLVEVFKIGEKIEVRNLVEGLATEALIIEYGKNIAINNVGFGISQVLPLVLRILVSDGSLIIVDEPECHLHPAMQSLIGEFLIKMTMIGKKILIETHSEYIINTMIYYSLLYENFRKKTLSYWIFKEMDSSHVELIEYDDLGYVKNQPDGFLDERKKQIELLSKIRSQKILGNKNGI